MKRTTLAATLALPAFIGLAAIGYASSDAPVTLDGIAIGDTIGMDQDAVSGKLAELGYELTEFETDDDGYLDVEFVAGMDTYELEIDAATGAVLEIELDDTDNDDDDGDDS